jgi:MPBQ/MSBQ methyltransferase
LHRRGKQPFALPIGKIIPRNHLINIQFFVGWVEASAEPNINISKIKSCILFNSDSLGVSLWVASKAMSVNIFAYLFIYENIPNKHATGSKNPYPKMQKPKSIQIPKPTRYQNAAIDYYMGMTNSDYLHYGYWEPLPCNGEELTITKFRVAQEAYAEKLFSLIPKETNTILDVGCGIGGNARYLTQRGFKIEGLAPDVIQEERFIKNTNGQVPFYLTRFEDFQKTKCYDLILFSESSQYVAVEDLAQGAANLVSNGGYLLIADMMRIDAQYQEGIFSNCHVVSELQSSLQKAGFNLVKSYDISKSIAPTIDLCIDNFRTFGLTTVKYISDLVAIAVPPLHTLGRWAFKRWLDKPIAEGLAARAIFEKHLCYEIQLWQFSSHEVNQND